MTCRNTVYEIRIVFTCDRNAFSTVCTLAERPKVRSTPVCNVITPCSYLLCGCYMTGNNKSRLNLSATPGVHVVCVCVCVSNLL